MSAGILTETGYDPQMCAELRAAAAVRLKSEDLDNVTALIVAPVGHIRSYSAVIVDARRDAGSSLL